MRERAPTPEMLASVQRLTMLAQVGSVTIDEAALAEAAQVPAASEGASMLRGIMNAHGVSGIDIATTITDAEFFKLGGLLIAPPSAVTGAIVESADALAIWNVRWRVRGVALRPTPAGMRAILPSGDAAGAGGDDLRLQDAAATPSVPPGASRARPPSTAGQDTLEAGLTAAIRQGEAATVFQLLNELADASLFEQLASADALHLVVELLLEHPADHVAVQALLQRAGVPGARAVFEQLIATTELADRRFLYDVAASLPATLTVASHYANDPTWYVARNAAGLLGESRNPAAVADLARLLRHQDTRVRISAVVALGQIGGATAMARLESVLFDPVTDVRNRALAIVFAAPDADPLADRLMLAVQEESTLEYQLEIIAALSHVHTPRARQKLVEFTRERSRSLDDLQIRLAAIGALGSGHRPAADDALRALTKDEHSLIRERAAAALAP